MPRLSRRRLLLGGALGVAGLAALRFGLPWWWRTGPPRPLTPELSAFADRCWGGIDRRRHVDGHVHLLGTGAGGSGASLDPAWTSHLRPVRRLQYELLRGAAGLSGDDDGGDDDAAYVARLLERHRAANPAGRRLLLALDRRVGEDGREDLARSLLHVPSEWATSLAAVHPEFLAAASVHPHRRDALQRLERAAAAGARAVKWLPAAQGIDPSSPRCDAFYRRLAALRLPLLTHAGHESALSDGAEQHFGNPLRLRRPLDLGVTVVVAHAGSGGRASDLDAAAGGAPGTGGEDRAALESLDLFLRLFDEPQYERTLFADISGLTFLDRMGRPLRTLLAAEGHHHRLVDGSDYPVCALDPAVSTTALRLAGLLDPQDESSCAALYDRNPLLFDLAVKRCVRWRSDTGRAHRFADAVFETAWLWDPAGA